MQNLCVFTCVAIIIIQLDALIHTALFNQTQIVAVRQKGVEYIAFILLRFVPSVLCAAPKVQYVLSHNLCLTNRAQENSSWSELTYSCSLPLPNDVEHTDEAGRACEDENSEQQRFWLQGKLSGRVDVGYRELMLFTRQPDTECEKKNNHTHKRGRWREWVILWSMICCRILQVVAARGFTIRKQ